MAAEPIYLDISVPPGKRKSLPVAPERHSFAYVFAGSGKFQNASGPKPVLTEKVDGSGGASYMEADPSAIASGRQADNRSLVLFDAGDEVVVQAGDDGIRFLLISGKPLKEARSWRAPIVMNTQEQLRQAFDELQSGTFLTRPPR